MHQKTVVVCAFWREGQRQRHETRTYATTTGELLKLADLLDRLGITHLAIESTGVYWKPVYWVLESHLEVSRSGSTPNTSKKCRAARQM